MGAEQSICCSKRSDSTKSDTRNIAPRKEGFSSTHRQAADNFNSKDADARSAASTPPNVAPSEKVGIGAYFQRSTNDPTGLAVKSLLKGSPAQRCGKIQVGDVILTVNGDRVYGKKLAELAEVLLGASGSKVAMKFRNSDGLEYDVEVERGIPGSN